MGGSSLDDPETDKIKEKEEQDSLHYTGARWNRLAIVREVNDDNNEDSDGNNYNSDILSEVPREVLTTIILNLGIKDLISVQSTSRSLYHIIKDNLIWKDVIKKNLHSWTNKSFIVPLLMTYNRDGVIWKRVVCDLYRVRTCKICLKKYRNCTNVYPNCKSHSDIRDIVDNRGVPSGVYW
eukprot:gene5368-6698_t